MAIVVLVGLTILLYIGVDLYTYPRGYYTNTRQDQLVDHYNSYSGNVASLFGRALETLVGLIAQTLVLWLMTESVLALNTKWHLKIAVLALNAGVGFLLTNSLNSANVRVHNLTPKFVMMENSDVSFTVDVLLGR